VRSQYDQGRAVGVLEGTIADLSLWFGLGENSPGWIQPGSSHPVLGLVQQRRCEDNQGSGIAQNSEWLSLGFWVAVSQRAANPCNAPHSHGVERSCAVPILTKARR
jgi:hypothetical protein